MGVYGSRRDGESGWEDDPAGTGATGPVPGPRPPPGEYGGYQDPGYQDPGYQDPGYQSPGHQGYGGPPDYGPQYGGHYPPSDPTGAYGGPAAPSSPYDAPSPRRAAAAAAPPRRRPLLNRTTIIIAALLAVLVGAGTAGAATFLAGGDEKPKSGANAASPAGSGSAPGSSAPAAPASISMSATGDVVMGMAPNGLPPNNGKGFFDPVAELLKADFQMMNLEQTITDDTGVGKCSADSAGRTCFAFRTPPATVQNLKDAGTHLVSMANNHAYDFGEAGYKNTQKALDSVGIQYTGAPGAITVSEVKGLKVATVGFASYEKWSNLCYDLPKAGELIKKASEQADLVVVQVHMGAEGSDKTRVKPGTENFLGENRCDPIAFSHAVVDAGADLVVGHGPHVVRGMEFYKGRLIAYSLGNFAGYRALGYNGVVGITAVIRVTLNRDGSWGGGTLIPTHMVAPGLPRPDPKKQAITMITDLTKKDFPQTGPKIAADGTITAP
jgi:hypothetical protein